MAPLGFGRITRHSVLNDLICCTLSKAGFPSIKEPPGLLRSDGLTLIPWQAGRSLVWDNTVIDTLAASYLPATAAAAGAAAGIAAERKNTKYNALIHILSSHWPSRLWAQLIAVASP